MELIAPGIRQHNQGVRTYAAVLAGLVVVGCASVTHPSPKPSPSLPPLTLPAGETVLLQASGHGSATLHFATPGTAHAVQFLWNCVSGVTGAQLALQVAAHSYVASGCVEQPQQAPVLGGKVPLTLVDSAVWELVADPGTSWRLVVVAA